MHFETIKKLFKQSIDESNNMSEALQKLFDKVYEKGREDAPTIVRTYFEELPTCNDTISRVEALESAKCIFESKSEMKALCMIRMLEELPPVQSNHKGHWIERSNTKYYSFWERYKCSECGHFGNNSNNYCSFCGADMRGNTSADSR